MNKRNLQEKLEALLSDGYGMMAEMGMEPFGEEERSLTAEIFCTYPDIEKGLNLAAAGQCFYCFCSLHNRIEENETAATLLGDYFFSRFSHFLIPLDSRQLIEEFSLYLQEESKDGVDGNRIFDTEKYRIFLNHISSEVEV
ncbi:hypothetical protein [Parasporobacterium paucivorans]|nr:hypothetical protein [Parasporobacterium paucivorans]